MFNVQFFVIAYGVFCAFFAVLWSRHANVVNSYRRTSLALLSALFLALVTACILQSTYYVDAKTACSNFDAEVVRLNVTTQTVVNSVLTCPGIDSIIVNNTLLRVLLQRAQSEAQSIASTALDITDDIRNVVSWIQSSVGLVYLMLAVVASMLLRDTVVPLLVLAAAIGVIAAAGISVLQLQANLCMAPAQSIINHWDIGPPIDYYIRCAVTPQPDRFLFSDDISPDDAYGQILASDTFGCDIVAALRAFAAQIACAVVSAPMRELVDTVCIDCFGTIVTIFVVVTLVFAEACVFASISHFLTRHPSKQYG